MYTDYFGLKEASFSISPDPQYLYLSLRHREALAHLLYGAQGNGGFVQLTGEVGTGKTTVCRAFVEQIPQQVDLALILNPALTVIELLQAVCQEFHIQLAQDQSSRMILVDKLNTYLLQAHANGRHPVLMIDEAQNLSPEVLEQLRLLTNLETSKQKLLQIFLIGQPELQEILQRKELRQLAQRITARYHLTPLNEAETADYIKHRLAVGGVERTLFTRTAVHQVHKLSKGIPRVINMLCDRALLGAFATHQHTVDASIIKQANAELHGKPRATTSNWWWLVALGLLSALVWSLSSWQRNQTPPPSDETDTKDQTLEITLPRLPLPAKVKTAEDTGTPISNPVPVSKNSSQENLEQLFMERHTAFNQLLSLWKTTDSLQEGEDPCQAVTALGLRCFEAKGTWNNIRHYQRPVLLQLRSASAFNYVLVTGLGQQTVLLHANGQQRRLLYSQLEPFWFGDFVFLWLPPPTGETMISQQSSEGSVRWLRQQLSNAGIVQSSLPLAEQVMTFQEAERLTADGMAGPNTLIHLNTKTGSSAIPRLHLEP